MKSYLFLFAFAGPALTALPQQSALRTVIQKGHDQSVLTVAITPDSNYVVTGSRDKSAKLWKLSSGREVRSFLGHEGSVNCADVSRDGRYLVTSSADKTARLWDMLTGKEIFSTEPENKILTAVAFSPDMTYFITAGYPDDARVWDMATKKIIRSLPVNADQGTGYGINFAFSPDGHWLAFGEDNRVASVYSTSSWQKIYTFSHDYGSCGGCPTWIAFSSDSQFLVMASNNGPVKRYSLKDGSLANKYSDEEKDLAGLSLTPDDTQVLLVAKNGLVRWDAASGKEIDRISFKPETEVNEAAITRNGKKMLLACANNTAAVWDLAAKKETGILSGILNEQDKGGITYNPNSYWESHIARYLRFKNFLLLSNDGKRLLKGRFGTKVRQWDIATGRAEIEYTGHEKAAICYEFSDDGRFLLTGGADGKVILWDAVTGDTLKVIHAHQEPVFDVHFSHDEKKILCSSWDATLKVFDLASGKRLEYFDFQNASAYNALYGTNDLYIFTAQLDLTLKMWEIDTKKVVREFIGHTDVISSITLSADNKKLLSASWDGSIRLWDIATGLMDAKFLDHKGGVYTARFAPDGKSIFSGGADRLVRMWDINSGKITRTFEGHQAEVTSILVSNDEKMLITHSTDGVTKFWDLTTGNEFFEHIHLGEKDWMVMTREGYFNGTEGARQTIHFVDGLKTYSVDQFFNEFYRPDLLPKIFKTRGDVEGREGIQGKLKSSPLPSVRVAAIPSSDPTKLDLYVKITDLGGGVKDLKVFHNGKNILLDRQALKLPSKSGESTVYKHTVSLVGGTNIFTASATNRDNVESDPGSVEYVSSLAPQAGACHVLAIGINEYKNQRMSLNYAKPDAESFVESINKNTGRLFQTVKLHTLYNSEASRENILKKLDELSGKIYPEDVFIFYYAGHGSMVENKFFFIPSESLRLYDLKSLEKEAIEARLLQEKFGNIKALKQLIIMDACQSGGSVELLATRGASEEKAIAQLSRSAGIHVMASAGSEQFATEFAELGHGLFTYVLMRALAGEADGAPKDGKVTIYELKSFIDDQVPEMTHKLKGKPQYPYTFSRGQDFPIVIER